MTDSTIISSLAQLAALRIQFNQLVQNAANIATAMQRVEEEFTQILSNVDPSALAKRDPTFATTPAPALSLPGAFGTSALVALPPANSAGQVKQTLAVAEKVEKVYPGYPKKCEWCNDFTLKTPRSKSGHERKCPGKPKTQKPDADRMSRDKQFENTKKEFSECVDSVAKRNDAGDQQETRIGKRSKSIRLCYVEDYDDEIDDYGDEFDQDDDTLGSLEDFIAPDNEEEVVEASEEQTSSDQDEDQDVKDVKRASVDKTRPDKESTSVEKPKKRRKLVKRSHNVEETPTRLSEVL